VHPLAIRVAVTALAFVFGCATAAPAHTEYGAQSHVWPRIVDGKAAVDTAELDAIAAAGFTIARVSMVPWWQRKRPDGSWNFLAWDALYKDLLDRGVTPLFMLANPRTPADVATIAAYCAAAAPRYPKALVELGNEPDSPSQWPAFYPPARTQALTPAEYWSYAKQWAQAWRSAQPGTLLATAGTSGVDLAWQRGLVAAGAASSGLVAAFGVHPYGEHIGPGNGPTFGEHMETLGRMLPQEVDIWVTEYGELNATPATVAAWLRAAADSAIPVFSWYELRDDPQPYGLLRADLSHKSPDPYAAAQAFLHGH